MRNTSGFWGELILMDPSSKITYIGHATVLIEIDGVRLLTDPVLRKRVWHLQRQHKYINPDLYKNLDAVLISHAHGDHLDPPSLKLIDPGTRIIASFGTQKLLKRQGFQNIIELSQNENVIFGGINIRATYAQHNGARYRYSRAAETIGFVAEGSSRIYFAGDTELFAGMVGLADGLDLALLPVWGWGPNLGPGHLDPYQAAQALQMIRPKRAVPIHWGTYMPFGLKWILPSILIQPPQAFSAYAARLAPEVKIHILMPGEFLELPEELKE